MTITSYASIEDAERVEPPRVVVWIGPGRWDVYTGADCPHVDVPTKVTRRQFKQGLTRLGIRPAVEAWRAGLDTSTAGGQDAADWYDDSNDIERANPILNSMATQFGLTAAQVDAAFVMMAGL